VPSGPPPQQQPPQSPYGTPPASSPYGPPGGQPPYQQPGYPGAPYPGPAPGPYGTPGYPSEPPPFQQPGYQQPYYSAYRLPKHSGANTALVLGLVGLIGAFFCGFPILASPFAWYFGGQAIKEIDAQPGRWDGRDQARAGQILGIIGTVLLALAVLFVVFFIVLIGATSTSGGLQ